MAATAVLASVMVAGTAAQMESGAQQRRLAGQAKNRQESEMQAAENQKKDAVRQEENRAFSKIQRQRQRALASGSAVPSNSGGGSVLGAGAGALAGGAAPASAPAKATLGS